MPSVLEFAPNARANTGIRRREKRRWQRVDLNLRMRFLNEEQREVRGMVLNIGSGGLLFKTKQPPFRGQRIVCYVETLGRLSGHVVRSANYHVAMAFNIPFVKRDRLADQLTWLANKDELKLGEERRAARESSGNSILVHTADNRELKCHVIDMSLVGVALATSAKRPLLHERVQVGTQQGVVARYLPEGFAVDFTR